MTSFAWTVSDIYHYMGLQEPENGEHREQLANFWRSQASLRTSHVSAC